MLSLAGTYFDVQIISLRMWNSPLHCLSKSSVADGSLVQFDLSPFTGKLVFALRTLRIFFLSLQGRDFTSMYLDGSFQSKNPNHFSILKKSCVLSLCSSILRLLLEHTEGKLLGSLLSLFFLFLISFYITYLSFGRFFFQLIFQVTSSVLGCFYFLDLCEISKLILVIIFSRFHFEEFWFSDDSFQRQQVFNVQI